MKYRYASSALFLATLACYPLRSLEVKPEGLYALGSCSTDACPDTVSVAYIGVGGFVIRSGTTAILTGPSYTHPSLLALLIPRQSNADLVAEMFHHFDATGIRAAIVGHSHYDHLMDMPTIMRTVLPIVPLYGSPTTKHVLAGAGDIDGNRITAIDTMRAGSATRVGEWFYVNDAAGARRFRFMAVVSTHAPNVGDFTIANDTLFADLTELPSAPGRWPKGEVYAYVIDLLDVVGSPVFRIFYQDAASDPEHSVLPPFSGADNRPVDLAIVCAGNFSETPDYPTALLGKLHPRFALVGHWESFFRGPEQSLQIIPLLRADELRKRLRDSLEARWATLRPFSVAKFPVAR